MSSKSSVELQRVAALPAQGCSNSGFQNDEDGFGNQNTSGNDHSLRNRIVQNREHENGKQVGEHITIEQDSLRKDEEEEDDQETHRKGCLGRMCGRMSDFCREHKTTLRYIIWGILIAGYLALVIAACVMNFHRALPLFVITVVAIFFVVWDHFMAKYESQIARFLSPGQRLLDSHWFWLKWVIWGCLILAVILWLVFDTAKLGQQQLVSFGGLIMYTSLTFLFSKHPTKVYWRPVFWGIGLQFLLGLLILRTEPGFMAFDWLGKQVQVLPIVIFFSTVMSMLYYLGLMQWIIRKVGWVMLVTMGTSPVESVVASGNIFVGQTESPLLVRPYLPYVTKSELHAIMTAGFSTIAGSVLGAYISFGITTCIHLCVYAYFQMRSEAISTYALCGFANFGSLGIVIGGLSSMAPSRKRDITAGAMRALIAGTIACFLTACIAGILTNTPVDINCHHILENAFNSSLVRNTTNVVSCCQGLLSSTVVKGPGEVIPTGNHSLYSLKNCCNLLNPPTLNCSWIPNVL
ncbi:hypothetical protein G4228_011252 [Cervus hanglu yarkandensis]|nr:hypothetical protein G4228_011252 [Cervus hanglu yarkandensis]